MKGSYSIRISRARNQFKFTLTRNITIIRGKSATGKTSLINMIREYEEQGQASGISLSSPKSCRVLTGRRWLQNLEDISDNFVFVDEGEDFVSTPEFAKAIARSDNYYVIVSRDPLHVLPYSVEEIYELKNTTSRYAGVRKYYAQTKRMYVELPVAEHPEIVIVEDAKAGFQFFEVLCKRAGIECVSAMGKTNIFNVLKECSDKRALVIADGAAFGPEMEMVYALAKRKGAGLFLPESFEWLILSSGLVADSEIAAVLDDPSKFIESRDYLSWERFFEALLREKTQGTRLAYSKTKLNEAYLQDREFDLIARTIEPAGIVERDE